MWRYKVKHDIKWEEQACQGDVLTQAGVWLGVQAVISEGSNLKEVLAREAYQVGKET